MNLVGGLDEATALKTLDHADPYVRLWTARLLCDASRVSPAVAAALARRAAIEPDVEVRSQLACSAKRLPAQDALPIVRALLARSEDARDIHLPLLLWWALEAKVATDPEAVLALFQRPRDLGACRSCETTIAERLMRRFAAAGTQAGPDRLRPAPGDGAGARSHQAADGGVRGGRTPAGRSTGLPPELADALAQYSGQSVTLGLRQGKPEAVSEALHVLADDRADRSKQLQLLQILGEVRRPACVPVVLRLACQSPDNALRSAALERPGRLRRPGHRRRSHQVLCQHVRRRTGSRPKLARDSPRLGGPVSRGDRGPARSIPARVPREVVEKLLLLGDSRISDAGDQAVRDRSSPPPRPSFTRRSTGWPPSIRAGSGVPKPGKQIFDQQCPRCHTLFGKGGKVGPDLTTYRRDDLETMLLNIVNPSAEIREGYVDVGRRHDRRPGALRRRGRARQERRRPARQRRQRSDPGSCRHRRHATRPELDHARRSAQGI